MNRVIVIASAALALVVVSQDASATVRSSTRRDATTVGLSSPGVEPGVHAAYRAIKIPHAVVAEQRRGGRQAAPRGSAGRSGGAGRAAGRAPSAGRAPRAPSGRTAVRRTPTSRPPAGSVGRSPAPRSPAGRSPGRATGSLTRRPGTVTRTPGRTVTGRPGRVIGGTQLNPGTRRAVPRTNTRVIAPNGRTYGYGGRGNTRVIVNNRYYGTGFGYRYGYGWPYRTYYRPGISIGFSYGYPYYGYGYGYGYGYPYYGYDYPYSTSYGYYGSGAYVGSAYDAEGSIRLKVTPRHADVFVDGYYVGVVDDYDGVFQRLRLAAGPHQIEIAAAGFTPITFDVRILPGRKIVYEQHLLPLP